MYEAMLMPCGSISCLKTLALYLPLALDATGGIHGFSPLHEHKPLEQGEEHFFSVFFARTDRGQRNDYRSHCSGDAVSSQLHLGHAVPKLQGTSDCTEGITLLFTAPGQSEQGENVSF